MAAEFLASHGIDLQKEMSKVQFGPSDHGNEPDKQLSPLFMISRVRLVSKPPNTLWDIHISEGRVKSVEQHPSSQLGSTGLAGILDGREHLLAPSLCHPHIHLDKCFLLSDPKYSDLCIVKGDFPEAMDLTNKAKSRFTSDDLLRRGGWLIDESVAAGVTHMRAFVEVDTTVGLKCLNAGLKLKETVARMCTVQLCAFAQLALFSGGSDGGAENRNILQIAAQTQGVEVVGSTPYVEEGLENMKRNVEYTIDIALERNLHLDFHLDYHLDARKPPLIWFVLRTLREKNWRTRAKKGKTIVFGHCTRLTLFGNEDWERLKNETRDLPVHFVGLPTSDLFMMGRPSENDLLGGQRARATLQIPQMVQSYGLNAAIGVNNVGNAFTPQGNCDPMSIASLAVGVYQAGTIQDAKLIYVSSAPLCCGRMSAHGP